MKKSLYEIEWEKRIEIDEYLDWWHHYDNILYERYLLFNTTLTKKECQTNKIKCYEQIKFKILHMDQKDDINTTFTRNMHSLIPNILRDK